MHNKNIMARVALLLSIVYVHLWFTGISSAETFPQENALVEDNQSVNRELNSIPKIIESIQFDGILDDDVWMRAQSIELLYETSPSENIPAKESTKAFVYEDGDFLYVGFKVLDSKQSLIRASYRDRDQIEDEDRVGIKIDTFDDGRRTYNFFVNPLGIQLDSISDDILDREDDSWNAIWYSKGQLTEDGYSVEIKIPFKVLRFKNTDKKKWAMDLVRYQPRDYPYRFASNKVERSINCSICQYKKYHGLENIQPGRNLEIIPYAFVSQNDTKDLLFNSDWQNGSINSEAGLDLRWAPSDSSVLNLAVNPDFSQVEADSVQFNVNTRFALFFDEKRPFFLDGADYFNTMLTIFYSRNIADPDFGLKYTSKDDNGSLGVLVSRDSNTNIIVPGSQSSSLVSLGQESDVAAARYAYDLSDSSLLGVTVTHRGADDYSNDLISLDGKHQLTETDVFRYQLIHTETSNPLSINGGVDQTGSAYRLNYSHNDRDWSYFASHNHFDEGFRADLGFLTRSGYRKSIIGGGRRWYGDKEDFFSRIQLRADWDISYQYDGVKLEEESEATLTLDGAMQSEIKFHLGNRDVFFDNQWFEQNFYDLEFSFKPLQSLRVGFYSSNSDAIDFLSSQAREGDRKGYAFYANWQANRHFNVQFDWEQQTFDLAQGRFFDSSISNAKLVYQFNEKSFVRFLLRYSDTNFTQDSNLLQGLVRSPKDKNLAKQLLYAYKFDAKSVFYLGYSDNAIEDDVVTSLQENNRTVFAKFSYAFQL